MLSERLQFFFLERERERNDNVIAGGEITRKKEVYADVETTVTKKIMF